MKIGDYDVQVNIRSNCRRIILKYNKEENRLSVSAPRGTTETEIRSFLERNMDWIRRHAGAATAWEPRYEPGERHWCFGRLVTLGEDGVPAGPAYLRWRNDRLRQVLQRQLTTWRTRMGVRIAHVTLQEMTSRWGSCRARTGRLTFNTKLAMFDEAVIEETVVHELCHFFHADHSAAFYAEMTRWLPEWRLLKQRRERQPVRPLPPEKG